MTVGEIMRGGAEMDAGIQSTSHTHLGLTIVNLEIFIYIYSSNNILLLYYIQLLCY